MTVRPSLVMLLVVVAAAGVLRAADAQAAPAACPAMPATYTGPDDLILQVNAGRRDAVEACIAVTERLDLVAADTALMMPDVEASRAKLVDLGYYLYDMSAGLSQPLPVKALAPLPVSADTALPTQASASDRGLLADVQGAVKADLWFIAGLGLACFVGAAVIREWLFR